MITHPKQRVVHTNSTIGALDIKLPVSYYQFLHVFLSFITQEEIERVRVDTLRLVRGGRLHEYTSSICRMSKVTSTDLNRVKTQTYLI